MDSTHETNIYEVDVNVRILIVGSNPAHAVARINELLHDRITQYTHPDDEPPKFKVIGVCRHHRVVHEPKRKTIIEKHLGK